MVTRTQAARRILDDGEFYVVLDTTTHSPDVAGGFLERRCPVSASTPRGFECIGGFMKQIDGQWKATIAKGTDLSGEGEAALVAKNVGRADAIVALWKAKYEAFVGHHAR